MNGTKTIVVCVSEFRLIIDCGKRIEQSLDLVFTTLNDCIDQLFVGIALAGPESGPRLRVSLTRDHLEAIVAMVVAINVSVLISMLDVALKLID